MKQQVYKVGSRILPIPKAFRDTGYRPSDDFEGKIEYVNSDITSGSIHVRIVKGTMARDKYNEVFIRGHVISGNINNYHIVNDNLSSFKVWW